MLKSDLPLTEYAELDAKENVVKFTGVHRSKCQHMRIEIDSKEAEVTCKDCNTKINPIIWMLNNAKFFSEQFKLLKAREETVLENCKIAKANIQEDREELKKRSRTRCQHCRKMTAINLKHHKFVVLPREKQ